jgi:formylglycine-generating enzyme required for sulfatase activity
MSDFPWKATTRILTVVLLCAVWARPLYAQAPQKSLRNSLGMEFVLIPAGSFIMGSPPDEPYRGKSETPHPVIITQPFYMQTTEVTLSQWRGLMGSGFLLHRPGPPNSPVSGISWFDSQDFLKKLNALKEGRYRLPTEAEWEYAARAGSTTAYSWGNRIDCSRALYANSRFGVKTCLDAHPDLAQEGPAPVKSFAPNKWGLYDMHGNVWEWVQDWFAAYPNTQVTDPQGPPDGEDRVRRGGGWYSPGYACRSANRAYSHPGTREVTIGFRVVRELKP